MSTPLGGGQIIFAFSGIRHAWFPVISSKSIYPMFTKFGMDVYWVNSLHGIAFSDNSYITHSVIATYSSFFILKEKYFTYVQEKYLSYLYQIWYGCLLG